jgi:hypothetical protein
MSNWKPSEAGAATLCGAQYFDVNRPCVRERGHTGPHRAEPAEADPLTLRIISLADQHGTTFTAVCEAAWSAIDREGRCRALFDRCNIFSNPLSPLPSSGFLFQRLDSLFFLRNPLQLFFHFVNPFLPSLLF